MITWETLLTYNLQQPNIYAHRSPDVQTAYETHKQKLLSGNLSLGDYVKNTILQGNIWVLSRNKFPYLLEEGIEHFVFWMSEKIPINKAYDIVQQMLGDNIVVFENLPSRQSIKNLQHYQVFYKR